LVLLLGVGAIVLIGVLLTGSTKNLLTIAAALTAIPFAMQFVSFVALIPYKERPEEEFERIRKLTGTGVLDTELVIANKDGKSFDIPYAYVHEQGVFCFTPNEKQNTEKTAEYIRNFLRLNSCDFPVHVYSNMRTFEKKLKSLPPSDRDTCDEKILQAEGVLHAISM
jgi:hypothetical protein